MDNTDGIVNEKRNEMNDQSVRAAPTALKFQWQQEKRKREAGEGKNCEITEKTRENFTGEILTHC